MGSRLAVKGASAPEKVSNMTGGLSPEGYAGETSSNMARAEEKVGGVGGKSTEINCGATAGGGPPIFHSAVCLLLHRLRLC